jgi:hypothetical protein
MVNKLLTTTVKDNIGPTLSNHAERRGREMKKTKQARGFWSWLAGHGWDSAGSNG